MYPRKSLPWVSYSFFSGRYPSIDSKVANINAKAGWKHNPSENYILRVVTGRSCNGGMRKRLFLFLFDCLMIGE